MGLDISEKSTEADSPRSAISRQVGEINRQNDVTLRRWSVELAVQSGARAQSSNSEQILTVAQALYDFAVNAPIPVKTKAA